MERRGKKMAAVLAVSSVLCFAGGLSVYGAGPGDGLPAADSMTVVHGEVSPAAVSEQETVSEGMTAVALDVSIAEITGSREIGIADVPGGQGVYGLAYPKTVYRVIGDGGNGWIEIAYDGHSAYLDGNSGQVTIKNTWSIPAADEDRADLVKSAINLLGSRYQMGASDPRYGFDCSGLVKYLMKEYAGLELPRTSREQACQGTDRAADVLRVGDLITFGPSLGAVNHAGIYIGDGRMIHGDGTGKGVAVCVWNDRKDIPRIANLLGE